MHIRARIYVHRHPQKRPHRNSCTSTSKFAADEEKGIAVVEFDAAAEADAEAEGSGKALTKVGSEAAVGAEAEAEVEAEAEAEAEGVSLRKAIFDLAVGSCWSAAVTLLDVGRADCERYT